jgi:hypothetical protein
MCLFLYYKNYKVAYSADTDNYINNNCCLIHIICQRKGENQIQYEIHPLWRRKLLSKNNECHRPNDKDGEYAHSPVFQCSLLVKISWATVLTIKLRNVIPLRQIGVFLLQCLYSNSHLLSNVFSVILFFKYCDIPGWVSLLFTDCRT